MPVSQTSVNQSGRPTPWLAAGEPGPARVPDDGDRRPGTFLPLAGQTFQPWRHRIIAHPKEAAAVHDGSDPSRSRVHAVGRPWLERDEDACGFVVAGEGVGALACGAPGRSRRRGWGCYCAPHAAEIYLAVEPRA